MEAKFTLVQGAGCFKRCAMARQGFTAEIDQPFIDRPIALVGMMGAGKSTIGRRLASRLDLPFVDADHEIEMAAGRTVSEIFEEFGEEAFRDGERRVFRRLVNSGPCILATGGGAYLDREVRELLDNHCVTIWLNASLDTLVERTSRKDTRPLLRDGNPREILETMLAERGPVYAGADIQVESGVGPHREVVDNILDALNQLAAAGAD